MKQVLVVDDSRTASAMLKRMLEKEACTAQSVDSAEAAISYLADEDDKPAIIFMDHMMPGMDGFAAVRHIKSDSGTRDIPIIMYTSKGGDVYHGQAHALGAADVLSKPVTQQDLRAVLARLDSANDTATAIADAETTDSERDSDLTVTIADYVGPAAGNGDAADGFDHRAHSSDGHKGDNVVDRPAARAVFEARDVQSVSEAPVPKLPGSANYRPLPGQMPGSRTAFLLPLLLGLALLWALISYFNARAEVDDAQADVESLELRNKQLFLNVQDAINQAGRFDYGEKPLGNERLELLRTLVQSMHSAGYEGIIRVESHVGQFCLWGGKSKGLRVPSNALPIDRCSVIGDSHEEAMGRSKRQSAAFRDYLRQSAELKNANIQVQLVPMGASQPRAEYPAVSAVRTSGDWNRVARANNRVEFYTLFDE